MTIRFFGGDENDDEEEGYETGERAQAKEDDCRTRFERLLRAQAIIFMRWHRSTTLTDANFDDAYTFLLASQRPDWKRGLFGNTVVLFGAAVIGIGCNLATSTPPPKGSSLLIATGILLGILGYAFIYWQPSR